jgi:hypothetical protein
VTAGIFITTLIVGIFAVDFALRRWRENEWRRRWRDRDEE